MVLLLTFLIYKKLHYRIFLQQQSYFTHFSIVLLYTQKILLTIPLWFQVVLPLFHSVLLLFCHYAYQYPKPILKTINSEPLYIVVKRSQSTDSTSCAPGAFRLNFPVLLYQSTVNFRLFVILYTRDRGTPQSAHACKCCSVQTGIADAVSNILLNDSLDRPVIIGNHSACRRRNSAHWSSLKAALTMTVPCAIEQCCCHDRIRATYAYSVQFSALYNR